MKSKIYLFLLLASSFASAQIPELLYYKFEGTAASIPNLASSPPAGTASGTVVGDLTLGANTSCLGNGLIGSGSTGTSNYFDTKWNLSLSGSWSMHLKFNNYTTASTTVYYLLGDAITGGNSFRMFTNGAPGTGNIRLTANGMSNVDITGVFSATSSLVDIIIVYDSSLQTTKAYVNGVLNKTVSQTTALVFNGALFKLGTYATNTGMKSGMTMDEFGLFNRAITDAEIQSLSSFCGNLSTNEVMSAQSKIRIFTKENYLMIEQGKFGKYSILDISGRSVLSGTENSNAINISTLKKGVYIIQHNNKSEKFSY